MGHTAVYWGQPDDERLSHEHPDDAIEEYLSAIYDGASDMFPEEVIVYGFKRMEPDTEACVDAVLDCLLDRLDEDFADPEGDGTKPTEAMKAHARTFVSNILDEYSVWACELNGEHIAVKTQQWIEENCPHWFE